MVSVVLLSTEEGLSFNSYWCRLDSIWITEDLEPFEEVKSEHVFTKPLSRDSYYVKYPEIGRSESDEESSMTLLGFRNKHIAWRSKIQIKRIADRRNHFAGLSASNKSYYSNLSLNKHVLGSRCQFKIEDEKVCKFLKILLENVPPPPLEELNCEKVDRSMNTSKEFGISVVSENCTFDIDVPDYNEFVKGRICKEDGDIINIISSTLKRKKKISVETSSGIVETWYETIYGLSDLLSDIDRKSRVTPSLESNLESIKFTPELDYENCDFTFDSSERESEKYYSRSIQHKDTDLESISQMSELFDTYDCLERSLDVTNISEELISKSHCIADEVEDLNNDAISDDSEVNYARFAVYKIYQTLRLEGVMADSSSMQNLFEEVVNHENLSSKTFNYEIYKLAHIVDEEALVTETSL